MYEDEIEYALEKKLIDNETVKYIQQYDERLTENNVPIIYNLRHLRKYLNIKKQDQDRFLGKFRQQSYQAFNIPKKSGGYRTIEAPVVELKIIQKWIKDNILDKLEASPFAKGFIKNKSIYDNALPHVNKELVICIDLKDFFPTIKYSDVFKIFKYIGYTTEVSHELTQLCTNGNNILPQGSPASPVISNLVCLKLDKRLSKLAEKIGFTYTRYADDITLSGKVAIKYCLPLIYKIIKEEGFELNEKKTRLQYNFQRQEVTGLLVNKKVSITKKLKHELEYAIYFCQKYGVVEHMSKINCNKSFYKEHLYGIAYFVKMLDNIKGRKYLQELDKINWIY